LRLGENFCNLVLTSIAQINYTASTKTHFLQIMTLPKNFTAFLTVRLNRKTADAFRTKAKEYGGTSEVMREIVEAFIDGRLTVQPNPNRKTLFNQ
jgi:hypothetical protein